MPVLKNYDIEAKRKDKKEPWSDWTRTDNYEEAVRYKEQIESLGYDARIVERREDERN